MKAHIQICFSYILPSYLAQRKNERHRSCSRLTRKNNRFTKTAVHNCINRQSDSPNEIYFPKHSELRSYMTVYHVAFCMKAEDDEQRITRSCHHLPLEHNHVPEILHTSSRSSNVSISFTTAKKANGGKWHFALYTTSFEWMFHYSRSFVVPTNIARHTLA